METTIYVKRDFLKGKLCFTLPEDEAIQTRIAEVLKKCRDEHNDNVVLTISTPKNKRTLKQNALFHVYCQKIHDYTGQDVDSIKTYCKQQAMDRGYPVARDETGEIIIDIATDKPLPLSTREATTTDISLLIDEIQLLAAEMGIAL